MQMQFHEYLSETKSIKNSMEKLSELAGVKTFSQIDSAAVHRIQQKTVKEFAQC